MKWLGKRELRRIRKRQGVKLLNMKKEAKHTLRG
jgi:hypothetical protein